MATLVVTHRKVDFDAAVSCIILETSIRERFKGSIKFEFIEPNSTFKGVRVDPMRQFEQIGEDRIYHVDVGGSKFDHHRADSDAPSSAEIVDRTFGITNKYPEWKRLIRWVNEEEQGKLNCGCAVPAIIRGIHRLLGAGHDFEILNRVRSMVDAILENEKMAVRANDVVVNIVERITVPSSEEPTIQVEEIPRFGRIALITTPEELAGSLKNQAEQKKARLIMSFTTDSRKTAIMSCFPHNAEPVNLLELGIVHAVRKAELALRNEGSLSEEEISSSGSLVLGWYSHDVSGRVANLFNGSSKVDLTEENRTSLSLETIISIVKECVVKTTNK